ncbi:NAD+ synthase [Roseomonas genomospecies 6]|uniref:Glutamine-dependent NAD(+) synthetase n=1 Tax=Roseomonas genomospecies 6 TaxID=214106 RepID=A0A9W7TZR3_9PROT|nr:NAD+ synthase [Roseomonas genomospecies 6]KAA0681965.1 NAD+ synthase [Roseomonas genomospecies 6]
MTDRLSIALAQINPTVGNVAANIDRIRNARAEAAARGADLMVCPELVVTGYPPEDLVLKPFFLDVVEQAVRDLAAETADGGPALLVGAPWRDGGRCYNTALLLDGGTVAATRFKVDLPNYGVFDEKRVFVPGPLPGPINVRGVRLGVPICEDMWSADVIETLAESGAEILVVPNGSPFEVGKHDQRVQLAVQRVTESGLPLLYVNQVGGQDELVFDGASFALGADRRLVAQAPAFAEHLLVTRWERGADDVWHCPDAERIAPVEELESVYAALVLGLRDYVNKNRFPGVILGLSGGIDSALSAAIAVDALGAHRVHGVMMPSPYTSQESLDDAAESAELLGCKLDTVPIVPAMEAFDRMLRPAFAGRDPDITEENIQSRSRGITLMALSNKFGAMVLSTGNKSEMSVGYATLYGDMCGGYAVLKDVYKTTVYAISRWRNEHVPEGALGPAGRVVPERVLVKAPTAELKPGQTDQDTLPPYDELDDILRCLVEQDLGVPEIVARGHAPELVNTVWRMLHLAEYKRRQAPPGPKITRRLFNRERRYPITNGFGSIA